MARISEEIDRNGNAVRGLRSGYTTGSCAAAAAKAATIALRTQNAVSSVQITLPLGQTAAFEIVKCSIEADRASCSVIKDAGDDPDATDGAEIGATVEWSGEKGDVLIHGGKGVGVVTKPGLELPIGSPAINPVPRQMITYSVREALGDDEGRGIKVTVYVPRGEQLAKKTLNSRLGIIGGISILGTTGIVTPFSTGAYKACIVQGIDVALANGCDHLVLTTGRRSERFAQKLLDLPEEAFVQVADYIGFAVEQCKEKGVRRITLSGMVGKLSKIAAGNLQTHVDNSRMDHRFLAQVAEEAGLPAAVVASIRTGNTARQFAEIVMEHGDKSIFSSLCAIAAYRLSQLADGAVEVGCIMTDFDGEVLGRASSVGDHPHSWSG